MGTMARTAVVAGTATAVSGSMQQKSAASSAAQVPAQQAGAAAVAAPAAPAASGDDDLVSKLKELGELRDAGLLTEEEFAAQKAKVLNA